MQAQIFDIDYTVEDGNAVVRMYGKTEEGTFVGRVEDFSPYFYAVPEDMEQLKSDLAETEFEDDSEELPIVEVEEEVKTDLNEEKKVLKIYTTEPPHVPKLKDKIWDLESVKECREFDIPFYKRYLIDKDLSPVKWVEVEGETYEDDNFDSALVVDSIEEIEKEEDLGLKTVAFDIETFGDQVIMISFYSDDREKLYTTADIDKEFVEKVGSEKEIIQKFIEEVRDEDVDVITGYNTDEFDFKKLRERAQEHGLELSIGRNGERMKFKRRGRFSSARVKGRMHLDLYPFIAHVISPGLESETLSLDAVAKELLGKQKDDMSYEEMKDSWSNKQDLKKFAEYALKDSKLAYQLGDQLIPQILELSRITGLTPFDACRLTFGQLTENYLLREADRREIIAPNRPGRDDRSKRRRQGAYSGGFVYEPEAGLHEDIAVMDFRSLYPTVMVAHNISPDTLNLDNCEDRFTLQDFDYDFCQDEQGFFPELVEELVEERYQLKEKMKELDRDSQEHQSLNSRQQAEKILANSFYGYLGYDGARWYSKECAEATTYMGREYIQEAIEKAEEWDFEVRYGDSLDYSRQLVVKNPQGNIEFLEIGRFVQNITNPEDYETIAWDEEQDKVVFRPVKRAIEHEYEGKMLRFDTNRGRTIVTPQHSVYKYNGEQIQLADAEELEEDDFLVSLSNPPEIKGKYSEGDLIDLTDFEYESSDLRAYKDQKRFPAEKGECPYCGEVYHLSSHVHAQHSDRKVALDQANAEYTYIGGANAKTGRIPRFLELDSEFAWVLGFYCGDGSASTGDKQMISFGGQNKDHIQKVKEFFNEFLDDELSLIENIDSRTGNKMYYYRIQKKPIVSLFVNGLEAGKKSSGKKVPNVILNGDKELKKSFIEGYIIADGSREKEYDSRYNSESFRFSTKSSYLANQVQYVLKQLDFGENGYGREINDVSYKYRDDKPEIKSIRNTAPQKPEFAEYDFTPAKINNVEEVEPTKNKVYDLEVEGEHNFVDAEGLMLVHNTDSIFLSKENLKEDIEPFLDEVNKELPSFMELEMEGYFVRGFFTSTDDGKGAKKKYALLDEDGGMKITGFEHVRRDWSPIAKKTQKKVLREVLENNIEEAVEIVKETVERLKSQEVPVEELRIYTTLTKEPEEYGSKAPHVEAAKKAREKGETIEPETTIDYVITRGTGSISDRAKITKYADNYDPDYYIEKQILPVCQRVLKVFGYEESQLKGEGKQSGLGRFG